MKALLIFTGIVLGLGLLISPFVGFSYWHAHYNVRNVTVKVTDKNRIQDCSGNSCDSFYLIYTDKGTFADTDSMWWKKYRSSDLYGNLERGNTYTCKVYGWRLPFFSDYPNIINCSAK